jgi:hypothetical protein
MRQDCILRTVGRTPWSAAGPLAGLMRLSTTADPSATRGGKTVNPVFVVGREDCKCDARADEYANEEVFAFKRPRFFSRA